MEIKRAKSAGFCFGVKRAVDEVYKQIEKHKGTPIYTYGPIIHNQEVTNDLKSKGVEIIESLEEVDELNEGVVIIRSHGVSKEVGDRIRKQGLICVEATCPYVKKIHKIVEKASEKGQRIVIIGNKDHPEVVGIMGWSKTEPIIVQNAQEAEELQVDISEKLCIVSQTTFNFKKFQNIVDIIIGKGYDVDILNTICSATKERQTEASEIAKDVDAMIVIGDKHSSNSQKLFEICKNACNETYYIQTLRDLNVDLLNGKETVGITAGASTPNNIIEEVQINVRIKL